jgi:tricorn protease-like protein
MDMTTITIRVPRWMAWALTLEAKSHGMKRSVMVADMVSRRIHQVRPTAEKDYAKAMDKGLRAPF